MGVRAYVVGFKYSESEAKKFHDVQRLCEDLNVSLPKEVEEFFNNSAYSDGYALGPSIPLDSISNLWDTLSSEGIEINVADIPKDIKVIRFVQSY